MFPHYLEQDKDITHLSNYKTPAIARFYYELDHAQDINKLAELYKFSQNKGLAFLIISGGTNMLFAFDSFDGVIVYNNLRGWDYKEKEKSLFCYSAEPIWTLAQSLEDIYRQDIWHRFIGLPGSVGGAVYGNAGCFGLETESNFVSCSVFDYTRAEQKTLSKHDMQFSYRNSILKKEKKYFIISAEFDLSQKNEKYHSDVDNIDYRENRQPKGNSCGSFFKNPSREMPAGKLIEQVGLKGYQIGGAYFSDEHANFLMHDGSGNYTDLLKLIDLAQKKVFETFDLQLEIEVQIISNKHAYDTNNQS